jgi:hypothetical protein
MLHTDLLRTSRSLERRRELHVVELRLPHEREHEDNNSKHEKMVNDLEVEYSQKPRQ